MKDKDNSSKPCVFTLKLLYWSAIEIDTDNEAYDIGNFSNYSYTLSIETQHTTITMKLSNSETGEVEKTNTQTHTYYDAYRMFEKLPEDAVEQTEAGIKAGNENLESSRKEYTMLNNSMYRLKKEKEENEQQ